MPFTQWRYGAARFGRCRGRIRCSFAGNGHPGGQVWPHPHFRIGLIVFAVASALAALSASAGLLIFARGLQGIGGAMILPATLATINATFRDKERATAFGIWGAVMASMAAIGPLLRGWLTQTFSWHWIFIINIPIVAGLLLVGIKVFRGFDIPSTLLSAISLGFLAYGLIEATTFGWWTPKGETSIFGLSPTPFYIAVGILFAIDFLVLEGSRRPGRHTCSRRSD